MTSRLEFFLPKPPDTANGRASWQRAVRDKRAYWEQLRTRMAVHHGFPPAPLEPIARAELRVTWHFELAQHRPDPDNVIRRLKPAIDFLVAHGFLAGDTADHLTWHSPDYVRGTDGLPVMTTVHLTLAPLNDAGR